jgi:choline dehydrogenase-like flavoprotein
MILESMKSQGLTLHPDMFSTGESPHGSGHVLRTVYKGDRTTAANYFINKGSNLTIMTDTTVDKVILEGSGSNLKAVSVKVIGKDGTEKLFKAKQEIIISGGAYCSPTILLRSGIGPKEELTSHDIECKVDLPGVGKNLMDHLVCFLPLPSLKQSHLTTPTDRIHLLFHHQTKHHQRPPPLQAKRPGRSMPSMERRKTRSAINIPLRSIRLCSSRRTSQRLRTLDFSTETRGP